MSYTDWREPVRQLRATAGPATNELVQIADALGCPYSDEPHGVLSAIVEVWLKPILYGTSSPLASDKQLAYLLHLGHTDVERRMPRPVASAWIDHYLALSSAETLERLKLTSGDHVRIKKFSIDRNTGEILDPGRAAVVSSVGANGLVYFRGGNGKCAWPRNIRPLSKADL